MVDVTRQQRAEVVRVLACSPAPSFMQQELNAVEVLKHLGRGRRPLRITERKSLQRFRFPLPVKSRQLCDLATIHLRRGKTQFFFKGLL